MWRVFGGAALTIAGVVALIEAHSHRPPASLLGTPAQLDPAKRFSGSEVLGTLTLYGPGSGWSRSRVVLRSARRDEPASAHGPTLAYSWSGGTSTSG